MSEYEISIDGAGKNEHIGKIFYGYGQILIKTVGWDSLSNLIFENRIQEYMETNQTKWRTCLSPHLRLEPTVG